MVNIFFIILLLAAISSSSSQMSAEAGKKMFDFNNCGGRSISFQNISVEPLPVVLSVTSQINVTATVDIKEDIPCDALANLTVVKLHHIGQEVVRIPLPCVDDEYGSCVMNVSKVLHDSWYNKTVCPFLAKNGHKCQCPVKKGVYKAERVRVGVPFALINGTMAKLASGDYDIHFRLTNRHERANFGCLDVHAQLVVKHH